MGRLAELQKALYTELGRLLVSFDFNPRVQRPAFRRSTKDGWASFPLAFVHHQPVDMDVIADVGLRIDAVEKLVNEDKSHLSPKRRLGTETFGCEMGLLA